MEKRSENKYGVRIIAGRGVWTETSPLLPVAPPARSVREIGFSPAGEWTWRPPLGTGRGRSRCRGFALSTDWETRLPCGRKPSARSSARGAWINRLLLRADPRAREVRQRDGSRPATSAPSPPRFYVQITDRPGNRPSKNGRRVDQLCRAGETSGWDIRRVVEGGASYVLATRRAPFWDELPPSPWWCAKETGGGRRGCSVPCPSYLAEHVGELACPGALEACIDEGAEDVGGKFANRKVLRRTPQKGELPQLNNWNEQRRHG